MGPRDIDKKEKEKAWQIWWRRSQENGEDDEEKHFT